MGGGVRSRVLDMLSGDARWVAGHVSPQLRGESGDITVRVTSRQVTVGGIGLGHRRRELRVRLKV